MGIDSAGRIYGDFFDSTTVHGFVDDSGTFTTIDAPGATGTSLNGLDSAGQPYGLYTNSAGGHGFVDNSGTFTTVDIQSLRHTTLVGAASGYLFGSYDDATGLRTAPSTVTARSRKSMLRESIPPS
jgi:hypothetical protein